MVILVVCDSDESSLESTHRTTVVKGNDATTPFTTRTTALLLLPQTIKNCDEDFGGDDDVIDESSRSIALPLFDDSTNVPPSSESVHSPPETVHRAGPVQAIHEEIPNPLHQQQDHNNKLERTKQDYLHPNDTRGGAGRRRRPMVVVRFSDRIHIIPPSQWQFILDLEEIDQQRWYRPHELEEFKMKTRQSANKRRLREKRMAASIHHGYRNAQLNMTKTLMLQQQQQHNQSHKDASLWHSMFSSVLSSSSVSLSSSSPPSFSIVACIHYGIKAALDQLGLNSVSPDQGR